MRLRPAQTEWRLQLTRVERPNLAPVRSR